VLDGGAEEVRLEPLVGRVIESPARLQHAGRCQRDQGRFIAPCALQLHLHLVHAYRLAGLDLQAHDPARVVAAGAAADGRLVVAERAQAVGGLVDRPVRKLAHLRVGQVVALGVAGQGQETAHVVRDLAVHPLDVDLDAIGSTRAGGDHERQQHAAPGDRGAKVQHVSGNAHPA
jgi:hypothetical protein